MTDRSDNRLVPHLPTFLLAAFCWSAALPGQTLPDRWNRSDDWELQQTPSNPWADREGNLVWSAHHRRGGMAFGQSTNWNSAWNGWVSGGAAIYSGVAAIHQNGMTHECYYDVLWARHHLITPVVELRNVTGQPCQLAIGGSLTVTWQGPQGIAHDTPVQVQIEHFDTGNSSLTLLVDQVVSKPTPGGTPESHSFAVNVPAFTFYPQSRLLITVRGHNPSTFVSWVTLGDRHLNYVRSVTASETVRQATPPNPLTLLPGMSTRPLLGSSWDPVIANPPTNAVADLLALGVAALHQPTPLGTVLCEPLVLEVSTPGTPFAVALPTAYSLLGLTMCAQGASLTATSALSLSNALDITLGDL